ncbi:CGG triplet repeat-binding protein 1 [Rhinatrema bivittatum]|uniref:CGG triplet repeat-binding protein 1 n=1 Tax=Rhinatrema bivittatum TaxID=194408 RepID=UPI001128521C|nr:CGG triplet repeat-binding protein 1 [Rhinatrema bivittatum]
MQAEKERVDICKAWVKTLAGANIPLSKIEHPLVREFLNSRVRNGGAIPGRTQLTETYLPEVYHEEKEKLQLMLKDQKVAIIFDETCDDDARSVLNVLFAPLEPDCTGHVKSFLANIVFLDVVNHLIVAQAVVKAINGYQIDYNSNLVIDTDNDSYMEKAFNSVLSTLFPNSVHITCLAHIVNLVGESFRKPFQLIDTFVRSFKNMFYNSSSRKAKYLRFLNKKVQEKSLAAKASMPPSPVGIHWNSWFQSIQYHVKNFHFYKEFFIEECNSNSPVSMHTI